MKYLLFLFCFGTSLTAMSQGHSVEPVEGIRCGIWFDYDAAGNRIKRYYDCKDMQAVDDADPIPYDGEIRIGKPGRTDSTTQLNSTATNIAVFPNPTTGDFSIQLPKIGTHTHFHIYDIKGAIITSGYVDEQIYSGSMSSLAPGNYTFIIYYENRPYRFVITKL